MPAAITTYGPWLTRAEAAAYLRISTRSLDRMRKKPGGIRDHVIEGTSEVRFSRAELDRLLQ